MATLQLCGASSIPLPAVEMVPQCIGALRGCAILSRPRGAAADLVLFAILHRHPQSALVVQNESVFSQKETRAWLCLISNLLLPFGMKFAFCIYYTEGQHHGTMSGALTVLKRRLKGFHKTPMI